MDVKMLGNIPAYGHLEIRDGVIRHSGGMTLLQHYAGLAMQGILARGDTGRSLVQCTHEWKAEEAIQYADALVAKLAKEDRSND